MSNVVFVVRLKLFNICSFDYYFARFVWNTVHITYGIQLPTSFANMFGSWLYGLSLKLRNQILLGAVALCWSIWLNRNDMVFNKAKPNTSMQVIFRTTYWIRQWSMLHKEEERHLFFEGCRRWETLIMAVFVKFSWNFMNRIET